MNHEGRIESDARSSPPSLILFSLDAYARSSRYHRSSFCRLILPCCNTRRFYEGKGNPLEAAYASESCRGGIRFDDEALSLHPAARDARCLRWGRAQSQKRRPEVSQRRSRL